ncbi:MAG: D-alanyl-D-alanine dipeptidase [Saprospiraceae bacterium]
MRNFAYLLLIVFGSCGTDHSSRHNQEEFQIATSPTPKKSSEELIYNGFVDVTKLDPSIKLDIKYATSDNFTKSKIYDCPLCLLRPEAAEALVKAHKTLKKKGLGLKMFDCYRPKPYQQRLWDKVPNPDYVTPPSKGSMHSRGAAVDLTIVDEKGNELDMGTPYDFFGPEAHTDNFSLPKNVLTNRKILRDIMESAGFKGIRTEWWHFSYQGKKWPLSDYVWPCDNEK